MDAHENNINQSQLESKAHLSRVEQKIHDRAAFLAVDPMQAQHYLNNIFQPKNWRIKNICGSVIGFKSQAEEGRRLCTRKRRQLY